jgi:superfamily II DNA or RNA helicase
MNSFDQILKQLDSEGKDFEKLSKWYLENEPKFKKIFKKVWHFKNFPKRWGQDTGTDLIAETNDGEYWAIQSKNYDKKYYISKNDINSFLSDSNRKLISRRLLIATTNNIGANGFRTINDQEKIVHLELLDNLEKAQVNWPKNLSNLYPTQIKKHSPWPWQAKAIEKIAKGLKDERKGKIVMACGSGKTEMGIWVKEKLRSNKTLVVVPTLYLITQTVDRWCAHANIDFDFLAVCSDKTVVDKDSLIKSISETVLPSTTDQGKISNFLKSNKNSVIFSTYNSLPAVISAAKTNSTRFDLIIADEAHRTASNRESVFSVIHNDKLLPRKKIVYMTATPRIHSPAVKTKAKISNIYLNSMDDDHYGKTLFKLSFLEAVKKNILTDYRIFIIGYQTKAYKEFVKNRSFLKFKKEVKSDAKSLALKFSLIKSFKKYGAKKILSFHTRVKSAKSFANEFSILDKIGYLKNKGINSFWSSWIEGNMSSFDKKNLINQFKQNSSETLSLMTNAKCLTEGIDVPKIDTICFLDPKKSQVDIAQAVGRVMRKVKGKKIGNLIIPLPVSNNDHIEEKLYKSEYKEIFAVTNAMRDHDDDLTEVLEHYRKGLGKKTASKKVIGKIIIDLPESVSENFYKELKLKIIDRTTSLSKSMISMILNYKNKFKHLNFSEKDKKPFDKLFQWVDLMRGLYRNNKIPLWIKDELNHIEGFSWRVNGQTLDSIEGLIPESIFGKKVGYLNIRKLREAKLIEPKGFYPTMGQGDKSQIYERRLSAYYSLQQKKTLKKLNLIKIDLKKYIVKEEAIKLLGITASMFKDGTFTAKGKGLPKSSGVTEFYDRKIVINHHKELLNSLKIPGTDLQVPTNQNELKKLQKQHNLLTHIKAKKLVGQSLDPNLIKPLFEKKGFVKLYLKDDLLKYKNKINKERKKRDKYLSESDIRKKYNLKNIQIYRKKNLITPDAKYFPDKRSRKNNKPKPLYLDKTIKNFLKKNNVSIFENDRYLNITELERASGYYNVKKIYENGLIKEVGTGITEGGFTKLFDKKIVKKIKRINKLAKKLGFVRGKNIYIKKNQFDRIKKETKE